MDKERFPENVFKPLLKRKACIQKEMKYYWEHPINIKNFQLWGKWEKQAEQYERFDEDLR